ncbi:MAG: ribosome silencing factor [Burkholderiales bacterium]
MDIKKLQRAIVDGLEDVKGQHIVVFDTEHLSSLFERVIIASGTSNRQTRSLAASVRDAVKGAGFPVPRVEGEENGEWIIVDCGAAVVHLMQQTIRDYYHLEEIWGDKPVKLKKDAPVKLVKAEELAPAKKAAPAKKKVAAKTPATSARASESKKAALAGPTKKVAAKKATPAKTPAKKASPASPVSRSVGVKKAAATTAVKTAAKKAPAKKAAVKKVAAKKVARGA